ncbi:MAG: hypothetical protein HY043_08035 [Verrucomicrobia bacterium]|nr:hypothetical protein [Verrucomicrobiota bacterium]
MPNPWTGNGSSGTRKEVVERHRATLRLTWSGGGAPCVIQRKATRIGHKLDRLAAHLGNERRRGEERRERHRMLGFKRSKQNESPAPKWSVCRISSGKLIWRGEERKAADV